ncbi:hypothetical protein NDU88_003184 [Pleurodeles waltl]|uniref:Uncharacterized protein n=1 Tax=Pleurodeles waltl TaxID=8319 RepID=A0AAV7UY97_PLEWA|nr:hypothetical protein NDU88_003184 [Pleurodeles waltl]
MARHRSEHLPNEFNIIPKRSVIACLSRHDLTFGDEKWAYHPGSDDTHCTPSDAQIPAGHKRQRGKKAEGLPDLTPRAVKDCCTNATPTTGLQVVPAIRAPEAARDFSGSRPR